MRGHKSIEKLRRSGFKPSDVFVTVMTGFPAERVFVEPEMSMSLGGWPEIDLTPDDRPETSDFRCLVGLRVHLMGSDARVVKKYHDRIIKFRPAEIISSANNSRGILHYTHQE